MEQTAVFKVQPRESADWKIHTMLSPPARTRFSLGPVDARVKAGPGGRGALCLYCFGSGSVQWASLLTGLGSWPSP